MSIKLDPRMKQALQKNVDKIFVTISAIVKQAVDKYLQEDIDWRKKPK